ncbi:unnamed protein product [Vicia faba]|uniref:Uncharacterized protein n=1 Tax=Vicia faba TaxID=3906 RepID=A0AAV1B969_VICFA|nr:unnamed protein product [Vicia faba]
MQQLKLKRKDMKLERGFRVRKLCIALLPPRRRRYKPRPTLLSRGGGNLFTFTVAILLSCVVLVEGVMKLLNFDRTSAVDDEDCQRRKNECRLIYAGRQEVQQVDEARSLDTKVSEDESKALAMELMKVKAKTWLKLKVR